MPISVTKTSLKGFLWLGSSAIGRGLTQLFSLVLLSRLLLPADFGVAAVATVVVNLALIFSEFGIGVAVIRTGLLTEDYEGSAFWIALFQSIIIYTITVSFSVALSAIFRVDELKIILPVMGLGLLARGISTVSAGKINRQMKFRTIALAEGASYFAGYAVIGPLFALVGYGFWSLVAAYLTQMWMGALFFLIVCPPRTEKVNFNSITRIFRFGNGISFGRLFSYLAANADNLIISRWLGAESLGMYGRAYQILIMPAALFGQVSSKVLFPILSSLKKDQKRIAAVYLRSSALLSIVVFPVQAALFVGSEEIVLILLGKNWLDVYPLLEILSVVLYFRTSYKIGEIVLQALGHVYALATLQAMYAVTVICTTLFGLLWGMIGVAAGVAISVFVYHSLITFISSRKLKISPVDAYRATLPGFILGVVTYYAMTALSSVSHAFGLEVSVTWELNLLVTLPFIAVLIHVIPADRWGRIAENAIVQVQGILKMRIGKNKI